MASITSGNTLGLMDYGYSSGTIPNANNLLYADDPSYHWIAGSFNSAFLGMLQIRTKQANAATTGNTTVVSFTLDAPATVCVIHSDLITSKATWLTGTYSDTGENASLGNVDQPASLFCAQVANGATPAMPTTINLGGNCATTCSGQLMYSVMIIPSWRGTVTSITPGNLTFSPSVYSQDEQTTVTFSVTRTGGTAGACSVTIAEGLNPANGVLNTTSLSWINNEGGAKTGTVTLADVAASTVMTVVMSGFTGCVDGGSATATININALVPSGNPGTYSYASSQNVNNNELTTFQRGVTQRLDGSSGAVAVRMFDTLTGSCASGTDYNTIAPIDVEFADGASGSDDEVFTITANNVSANCTIVLGFTTPVTGGWTAGTAFATKIINIIDLGGGGTPPAQTYYISTSGNDSWNGLSPTFVSGSVGPWRNWGRADGVPASPDGDVMVLGNVGNYAAFSHIDPTVPGTNASHMKRYCASGGDVNLIGSGGPAFSVNINVPWVAINEGCPNINDRIAVDGQCVPHRQADSTGCTTYLGYEVNTTDVHIGLDVFNTYTWSIINILWPSDRVKISSDTNINGGPWWFDGNDSADTVWLDGGVGTVAKFLFDGGTTGHTWNHGGHAELSIQGGQTVIRGLLTRNTWNDIAGFSSGPPPDGNRILSITRNATNGHVHDMIMNRVGKPQDTVNSEEFKLEGTNNAMTHFVARNTHYHFMLASSAEWSHFARGGHIAHCVLEHGHTMAIMNQWGGAEVGSAPLTGYKFKNCILRDMAKYPGTWGGSNPARLDDVVLVIENQHSDTSMDITQIVEIDGLTIYDTSRNINSLYFEIFGTKYTIAQAMANWPGNFKNITVTATDPLPNSPAIGTDTNFSTWVSQYTPAAGDTTSRCAGSNLTVATALGSSSQSLVVSDAFWFPDPSWYGTPGIGLNTAGYQVNIVGVGNVAYDTINYSTKTLHLVAPATWSNGAAVNLPITVGACSGAPSRGLISYNYREAANDAVMRRAA